MNDEQLLNRFNKNGIPARIGHYAYKKYTIRYTDTGDSLKPMVMFIHGAPGSLDAFLTLMKDSVLQKNFRIISVDRPGYGNSGFGKPELSLEEQANALIPLVELNQNAKKPLIAGHSYGGTVAARLAMLIPHRIGAIHLVAAAVDPGNEKIFRISYPLQKFIPGWLVPVPLQVANEEKLSHISELKKMETGWVKINLPVTIIHGKRDSLVPVENAYFAQKRLTNAQVCMKIYENEGHLIPWVNPGLMKKEIFQSLGIKE